MHVLIGCEVGGPAGLLRDAHRVGSELARRGNDVTYVMADPVAFAECAGTAGAMRILAAPSLREPLALIMKRAAPSGFDDHMAEVGFAHFPHLHTVCDVWRSQMALLRPDAIVGFHSPALWLVGPTVVPTFAMGSGIFLPPRLDGMFPRLSANAPPLAADHVMLANANRILAGLGAPGMTAITDVLARCQELLYGLPTYDPYLQLRQTPTLGSLGSVPPIGKFPAKPRLAAFLDVNCPNIEAIMLGLVGAEGIPVDVVLRGGTAGMIRFLQQQPSVTVWNDSADLVAQMADMTGVIHHGDHDLAEIALVAGRPQLQIPWMQEQKMLTDSMGWMGNAVTAPPDASIASNAGRVRTFAKNASIFVQAQHHARQVVARGLPSALPVIADRIEGRRAVTVANASTAGASDRAASAIAAASA